MANRAGITKLLLHGWHRRSSDVKPHRLHLITHHFAQASLFVSILITGMLNVNREHPLVRLDGGLFSLGDAHFDYGKDLALFWFGDWPYLNGIYAITSGDPKIDKHLIPSDVNIPTPFFQVRCLQYPPTHPWAPNARSRTIGIHLIPTRNLFLTFSLLWYAYLVVRSRLIRHSQQVCPGCGYDLRATPMRCPECGLAVASTPSDSNPPSA